MNDEEWKSYHVPAKIKKDQPAETGDDLVDQWEKELFEGTLDAGNP